MPTGLDHLRVVLVRTRNPLNIGAVARAMSNFGIERLRVVNPYELAFREARSAVGAAELLAQAEEYKSLAAAVEDCTLVVGTTSIAHRAPQHHVHRLEHAAAIIREHIQTGNVALLFGSEKVGLSNRDLSHCHCLLRIPTREEHSSMNLAQAVAVCMYELVHQGQPAQIREAESRAAGRELEMLTEELLDILCASGYLKSRSAAAEQKIRRAVRRLSLDQRDAEIWLGMLRQIAWKLGRDSG